MNQSPSSTGPAGCALVIYAALALAGGQLARWSVADWHAKGTFNAPLALLFGAALLHLLMNARYILVRARKRMPLEMREFILGRRLLYLSFPAFAFVIAVGVWDWTNSPNTAGLSGIIGGYLVFLMLRFTLFAHEATYRDKL